MHSQRGQKAYLEDGRDAHGEGTPRHMLLAKEIAGSVQARHSVQVDHVSATVPACPAGRYYFASCQIRFSSHLNRCMHPQAILVILEAKNLVNHLVRTLAH